MRLLFVIEVFPAHECCRIVAYGKPCLCLKPLVEIVGSAAAAHLRGHPAGIDGVGKHCRELPRDGEREHHIVQLRVRIADTAGLLRQVVDVGEPCK